MTKRKFYHTIIQIHVLSDRPYEDPVSLATIDYDTNDGDCVGKLEAIKHEEVDGQQMTNLLYDAGSEPGFFSLDDDGNDTEDLISDDKE